MRSSTRTPPWSDVVELALQHRGVLHRRDLERLGLHGRVIRRRVLDGRLCERHPGVYTVGHGPLRPEATMLAALCWCRAEAAISHFSAAALYGWLPHPAVVHLTTTAHLASRDGVRAHVTTRLTGRDTLLWDGDLRVTNRTRTLVDLADLLEFDELRSVADKLSDLPLAHLRQTAARLPGRHGAGRVALLLDAEQARTTSALERRYIRYCTRHGLPHPSHRNHWVAGHKADCVYAAERLVVELDGRAYHERRSQMNADRRRDANYQLAGYRILRLVWEQTSPADPSAAETIRRLLAMP